jgi:hypothetical protein
VIGCAKPPLSGAGPQREESPTKRGADYANTPAELRDDVFLRTILDKPAYIPSLYTLEYNRDFDQGGTVIRLNDHQSFR